jgi:hypothetical protein
MIIGLTLEVELQVEAKLAQPKKIAVELGKIDHHLGRNSQIVALQNFGKL